MLPVFIVDSFTDQPFQGNPAGVVLADDPLEASRMQAIATELGFSETAFAYELDSGSWLIRYFSPYQEIPLCGHATLATSKVLFGQSDVREIQYQTGSGIQLSVRHQASRIEMGFPIYQLEDADVPHAMLDALGLDKVVYAGFNRETEILMLEIESSQKLAELNPDFVSLKRSHDSIHGVSVTAVGHDEYDFHSRYFWPWSGGEEDPVTGGTHTFLAKYWSQKLGKPVMQSFQSSARTGQMEVEVTASNSLLIRGEAVLILEGRLNV